MKTTTTHLVGVDPGATTFSLAFWNCYTKQFEEFHTGTVDTALKYLWEWDKSHHRNNYGVVVENPNKDTAFFDGWLEMQAMIKGYKFSNTQMKHIEETYRKQMKIAQNVGQNKMVAQQFIQYLDETCIRYFEVAPSARTCVEKIQKGNKYRLKGVALKTAIMPTKTNAGEFELLTGHKGRTNGHQRDASTLVFGRTLKWFELQQKIFSKA